MEGETSLSLLVKLGVYFWNYGFWDVWVGLKWSLFSPSGIPEPLQEFQFPEISPSKKWFNICFIELIYSEWQILDIQ